MALPRIQYAVIDVGSPAQGNLGWFMTGPAGDAEGTDLHICMNELSRAVSLGPLILGFEAPMYAPAGRPPDKLLRARPGEGNRPWSAGAGATTTAMALAVVPWVLCSLSNKAAGIRGWQDWNRLPERSGEILIFEAFVSGGQSDGHVADARAATIAARSRFDSKALLPILSDLEDEPCLSIIGAALLMAEMTEDVSELQRACLVVRAAKTLSNDPRKL
jgi:hypothetical protein